MEHNEPTLTSMRAAIDRTLVRGIGLFMLVGTTSRSIRLLQDDSEERLPLAEMI